MLRIGLGGVLGGVLWAALIAGIGGCNGSDPAPAAFDCGNGGSYVESGGGRWCAYVVITGGFDCPTELPYRIDFDSGFVCTDTMSDPEDVPDPVCMRLPSGCTRRSGDGGALDGGAADSGIASDAGGGTACGASTCGSNQLCVHTCRCGPAPLCEPVPDGGACPPGSELTTCPATGQPGCQTICMPEPTCVDVPGACGASPTCGCFGTDPCLMGGGVGGCSDPASFTTSPGELWCLCV